MPRYLPRNFFKKSVVITICMVVGELMEAGYAYAVERPYLNKAGLGAMLGGTIGGIIAHFCIDPQSKYKTPQKEPLISPVAPPPLAEATVINSLQTNFSQSPLDSHMLEIPSSTPVARTYNLNS